METFTQDNLRDMIAKHVESSRVPRRIKIVTDTSDFYRVDYDDVLILAGRPYFIRNYEREGRFTIDEQPKFWVKRAIDLTDGSVKIIKMVFLERFTAKVGDISFECVRSPKKEARILELTAGHKNFMHGFSVKDSAGNIIRVIEYIKGRTMADTVLDLGKTHEDYFHNHFPSVLENFIELVEAVKFLHDRGEKHGDIRRDHIIRDKETGVYRWIDFDFNYWHKENMYGYDLFGLGSILVYLAGRGDITVKELQEHDPSAFDRLTPDDTNIIFRNRVVNLQKVYPYVPDSLNLILMQFSSTADIFYDNTEQLFSDLCEVREELAKI